MAGELARVKESSRGPIPQPLRCWDGLHGCEQHKEKHAFKWHPLLCVECVDALGFKYGAQRGDAEMLTQLLHMDAGLSRGARYAKADSAKVDAKHNTREQYIPDLLRSLKKAGSNDGKIKALVKSYRDWFHVEVGMEPAQPARAGAFANVPSAPTVSAGRITG